MSDLKLFRLGSDGAAELHNESVALEKSLQTLIEHNLEAMLSVRLLASEYSTGKTHAGRIDTLGIDENSCPVILEYKRAINENVINQGLFYLDWLLDHKAEVILLVMNKYGKDEAADINWTGTRLLCIAADFTKYDQHAVQLINRNIELIRYRKFSQDILLFELINAVTVKSADPKVTKEPGGEQQAEKTWDDYLDEMKEPLRDLFESARAFLVALGDDVQEKRLSLYIAFKRLKNFVCVEIRKDKLMLYLKVNPDTIQLEEGFSRDVRTIGHWGTGDLELTVRNEHDLKKAQPLMLRAYAEN